MSRLLIQRLAWALVLVGGVALGAWVNTQGIVSAQAALRTLRATQVWFGGMPSVRSFGFELAPLSTLLELPLVLLPPLRSSVLGGSIVASLAAVLLGWSVVRALRSLGLGGVACGRADSRGVA